MIKIMSRAFGEDTTRVDAEFNDDQELRAILKLDSLADELAKELGTTVQESKDGSRSVVKTVDHMAVGREFWIEQDEEALITL